MGRPRSRNPLLDGVLVIDKPAGWTSHDVVAKVRGITGQRKAGHTGTLDPDATGVLVVCLGRATRLVRFLQAGQKTYHAEMVLGRETTTQDAAGEVVAERDASGVTEEQLCSTLSAMVGDIQQVPPMVSAVKVDGERLHAKARRGEVVEREPRPVTIHSLVLEDFEPGPLATASFLVTCSAGTYVRTLAHDAGQALGVGGSLTALRRTGNGRFTEDDAITLETLADAVRDTEDEVAALAPLLRTVEQALSFLPVVEIPLTEALAVVQGKPRPAAGIDGPYVVCAAGAALAVFTDHGDKGRAEVVLRQPDTLPTEAVTP